MNWYPSAGSEAISFERVRVEYMVTISSISLDIFTERLWRSLKYEDVYLKDYRTVPDAQEGIGQYFTLYNQERLHQSLNYQTPAEVYFQRAVLL